MYFTSYKSVLKDIEYHLTVKRLYKSELKNTAHCKGEWLRVREYKSRRYYTIVSDGEEKYVGAEDAHVKSIIKRHYLLETLRRIDENLALLSKVESGYRSINPNVIRNELPKAYRNFDPSMFELAGIPDMSAVENEYATPNGLYEDKRNQITDDGNLVRSKSEGINIMLFKNLESVLCMKGQLASMESGCIRISKLHLPTVRNVLIMSISE
ncbi:MAG: hypothetical protein IJH91_06755 [Mogibacterium sp.]|nr:hypothetical protein [Mogibacterium sp.]